MNHPSRAFFCRMVLAKLSVISLATAAKAACPTSRMAEPMYFAFNAEGRSDVSGGRACGSAVMAGYDPNISGPPGTRFKFAYLEAFGGPTGNSNNWWNMEAGEKQRVVRHAASCGMHLPSQSSRWLGPEGMRCILKKVASLQSQGITDFEIDNAGWLLGSLKNQFVFAREFTKMMENSGICNIRLVLKNLTTTEFRNVADSMNQRARGGGGINPRLISNFAIIEEHLNLGLTNSALSNSFITALQSRNTRAYAVKGFAKNASCRR